jgi:hypothetical protein
VLDLDAVIGYVQMQFVDVGLVDALEAYNIAICSKAE